MHGYLPVSMSVYHAHGILLEARRGGWFFGDQSYRGCELPREC